MMILYMYVLCIYIYIYIHTSLSLSLALEALGRRLTNFMILDCCIYSGTFNPRTLCMAPVSISCSIGFLAIGKPQTSIHPNTVKPTS